MRIFSWHVHGSYTTSLVQGSHDYLIARLPQRGSFGRGRADTWQWPASVVEVSPADMAEAEVDVVILQRTEELDLAEAWLGGRRPGRDLPALFLEHNAPQGRINDMRHFLADQTDIPVVHVTHFNRLFWDTGVAQTHVVEHGVVDPGPLATSEGRGPSEGQGSTPADSTLPRGVTAINEPVRRDRVTGTDLLPVLAERSGVAIDLFGMRSEQIGGTDVPQSRLHAEMARRRVYVHPIRWTSLGLTLLEAMHLGLPVVALGTTEVADAVPAGAGVVSNNFDVLASSLRRLVHDPEEAVVMGKAARAAALARFGLGRFLADWDVLLAEVTA